LDMQGSIVDINPAATQILDKPASVLCGRAVAEILPSDSGIEVQHGKMALAKSEIRLGPGDAARFYQLALTHLTDGRGESLGYLLMLHDTTGQKRAQEILMEQQRVVATLQERDRLARE